MANIAVIFNNLLDEKSQLTLKGNGKTILEHAIERIKEIKKVDKIFFGMETTASPETREILRIIESLHVSPIQMRNENFLTSLSKFNSIDNVQNVLFFNPVSPFIDPKLSSGLLSRHVENNTMFSHVEGFPIGILPYIIHREHFHSINLMQLMSSDFFSYSRFACRSHYLEDSGELNGLDLCVKGQYSLLLFREILERKGHEPLSYEFLKLVMEDVLTDLIENSEDIMAGKYFNRMLNRIEKNKKSQVCKSYPIYMHIGLNSKCNLKCSTCHHQFKVLARKEYHDFLETTERLSYNRMFQYESGAGLYKRKKNLDMDWGLYEKIAGSVFKYLREVRFGVNGETLLYKRLGPALARARENGVNSSIVSNGMLLNEKTIPVLLDESLKRLSISIDSTRNALLKKIRKGADLYSIIRKIKLLIDERERRNLGFPRVGFAFTAARENIEELPDLLGLAAFLGVGFVGVQFRYISNFMDPEESLYHHQQLCLEYFNRAREKANELKVELSLPSFGGYVADCDIPWTTINVSHDGNAVPCCTMNISRCYGILNGENFMEIWNGEDFQKFRKSFSTGKNMEYQCLHCILGDRLDFKDPLRFLGEKHISPRATMTFAAV